MISIFERISIEHPTGSAAAFDHWGLEYDYIWREGIGTSAGHKERNDLTLTDT